MHSAEVRARTTGLQLSDMCGPPLTTAALRQPAKLTWQRCASYGAAALGCVLSGDIDDCCGGRAHALADGRLRPPPSTTFADLFGQQVARVPRGWHCTQCSAKRRLQLWALNPVHFGAYSPRSNAWGRSLQMSRAAVPWSNLQSCLGNATLRSKSIHGVAFAVLRQTWRTSLGSKPTPLRPSGWNQRLGRRASLFGQALATATHKDLISVSDNRAWRKHA